MNKNETNPEVLVKRLRLVSDMIHMGEGIRWGQETALMDEAADYIESLQEPVEELFKGTLEALNG